jgi:hypothetical protein
MSDDTLTIGAAALELGVPFAAALLFWRDPPLRPRIAVILGALTPLLLLYFMLTLGYLIGPPSQGSRWSFGAVWLMSFVPHVASLLLGLALSMLPRPRASHLRFALGMAGVLGAGVLLYAGQRFVFAV